MVSIPRSYQIKLLKKLVFSDSLLDVNVVIKPANSLVVSLGNTLTGIASKFEWLDRRQLDSNTANVTFLSPGRGSK